MGSVIVEDQKFFLPVIAPYIAYVFTPTYLRVSLSLIRALNSGFSFTSFVVEEYVVLE